MCLGICSGVLTPDKPARKQAVVSHPDQRSRQEEVLDLEAKEKAKELVLLSLKYPDDAEFPWLDPPTVWRNQNLTRWMVHGKVVAKNSSGGIDAPHGRCRLIGNKDSGR
jgi:hypothetical protein